MVDEEIVMDTIRKMKESGLEDSIIISTLQDIGLSEEQAKDFIARVSGTISKKPEPKETLAEKIEKAPAEPTPIEEEVITEAMEGTPPKPTEKPTEITPEENQITEAIKKIKTLPQKPAQKPEEASKPMPEAIAEKAAEKVKYHIAEHAEEEEMRHATTQAVLGEQAMRLKEVQESIKKLQKKPPIKMPADTQSQMKALMVELDSLRKDVEETKALVSTTRSLMEKILEVNRKILSRLP